MASLSRLKLSLLPYRSQLSIKTVGYRSFATEVEGEKPRAKKPSPYRLLQPHTFLAAFAPLHVAGWRLDRLERSDVPRINFDRPSGIARKLAERVMLDTDMADLQDRRLVRLYEFSGSKEGWRDLRKLVDRIGEIVEEQDHHPHMIISPSSDYNPTSSALSSRASRSYVVELSTHTHTPMPPISTIPETASTPDEGGKPKIRPGVTGKDLNLANKVEEVYQAITMGIPS